MLNFYKRLFLNRIASVSKIFPTIMLYKMWEEGKVMSLDDPLERYAQNFVIKNPLGRLKESEQRYTADGLIFLEKGSMPLKPSPVTLRRMASQLSGETTLLPAWPLPTTVPLEKDHRQNRPYAKDKKGCCWGHFPVWTLHLCTSQRSGRTLGSKLSAASWSTKRKRLSRPPARKGAKLHCGLGNRFSHARWIYISFNTVAWPEIRLQLHNSFLYSSPGCSHFSEM